MKYLLRKIIAFAFLIFPLAIYAQKKTSPKEKPVKKPVPAQFFKTSTYQPKKQIEKKLEAEKIKEQFQVQEYTLSNGLKVYLSENHLTPKVFGMVAVRAGGKNDPKHATGMAHYLEHMLFKGTKTLGTVDYKSEKPYLDSITSLYQRLGQTTNEEERKNIQKLINEQSVLASKYAIPNELDRLLASIGSDKVNAHTTEDYTAYHNEFPSHQINAWLEIYSHRFKDPVFRLFQSELETVYEEKNRGMDNPAMRLIEEFFKNFYKTHPYGQQSIIGETEHLKNPPLHEMYKYFYNYYVANNMAIILSGDFDSEEVVKMIEAKFGSWESRPIPDFPKYEEKEFAGRELVEQRLTPIKIGLMGYRAPAKTNDESFISDIAVQFLSNSNRTGVLDELVIDGKLVEATAQNFSYNDYGAILVIYVPKIVGQSFDEAENLVVKSIERIRKGEFSDSLFQAIKINTIKDNYLNWERNEGRVFEMLDCFVTGRTWEEYSEKYAIIQSVTKKDIVAYAQKYLSNNYLSFHSKMGFPKTKKLEKPDFKPVVPKQERKSKFAVQFEEVPQKEPVPRFVDFQKEIEKREITPRIPLYYTTNPVNRVFEVQFVFGCGKAKNPYLEFAANYLNSAGTEKHTAKDFKKALAYYGCSYEFSVSESQLILKVTGMEDYIVPSLQLISELINQPKADEKVVKKIVSEFKTFEKFDRSQPFSVAVALREYALFGENSKYLRQLSSKQLANLTSKQLLDAFEEAKTHDLEIYYTGKIGAMAAAKHIKQNIQLPTPTLLAEKEPDFEIQDISGNKIYFLNDKKAVQSQLFFNIKGSKRNNKELPLIYAFNAYFGDDMSSLVFQEIREFRSLAYSAYGKYIPGKMPGYSNYFMGYIGCQDDKTPEAMQAMLDLLHNMPQKPKRQPYIVNAIKNKLISDYPHFREKIIKVRKWQKEGFSEDPNKFIVSELATLKFDDIVQFYQKEIQNKPVIMSVVGEQKRIKLKEWAPKTGEVVKVKKKEIYVN
jgi:predicted Zn-dependent peptidase